MKGAPNVAMKLTFGAQIGAYHWTFSRAAAIMPATPYPGAHLMQSQTIHFTLNDVSITCLVPLYWTLHDVLCSIDALPDVPVACSEGDCCRCTVVLDGRAVCACHLLAAEAAGRAVQTRAGLAGHPVMEALKDLDGSCGGCIDAFALAAIDYLQNIGRADGRGLNENLLAIPCACHIEPQVRQVVRHLALRRGNQTL